MNQVFVNMLITGAGAIIFRIKSWSASSVSSMSWGFARQTGVGKDADEGPLRIRAVMDEAEERHSRDKCKQYAIINSGPRE